MIASTRGLPLAAIVTRANAHDSTVALRLVDAIPPIRHGVGRPRRRPLKLKGDKAYDSEPLRRELRRRGIKPLLNRRRKSRRYRKLWPVERTQAWINQYRRLKVRYERLQCTYQAFLNLACALICYKRTSGRKMGF